eukprot:jgi/Astpho2/7750/Aster-07592
MSQSQMLNGANLNLRLSQRARPLRAAPCKHQCRRQNSVCHAQQRANLVQSLGTKAAGAVAAAMLSLSSLSGAALANEFDVVNSPTPELSYYIDDAGVLNKTTKKAINDRLYKLEANTGYRLEAVTVRKLEFEQDAFSFGDKVLEKWYPNKAEADKKGILIVVTTGKDGALTGGPAFTKAVGDSLIDSIIGDNIPILTEQEKWNETLTSCVKRIEAVLTGSKDPGAPQRASDERQRTYKTKAEVEKTKSSTTLIVAVLLVIAFVVPMLQYYGYVSKE